jgi:hypothetical protein
LTGHAACPSLVPPSSRIRRGRHGAVQAQVSSAVPAPSPRPGPRSPRCRRRYLLCELVSEDARCRLSLDDRVLGGLVRDTIARVHGAFGAAACSVGFAGTRALRMQCGARFARARPGQCVAFCTIVEGSRKSECGGSKTEQKVPIAQWDKAKSSIPSPRCVCRGGLSWGIPFTARFSGRWVLNSLG